MIRDGAAIAVGLAVWAAVTGIVYLLATPAAHAGSAAWEHVTGPPPGPRLCPETATDGEYIFACHLPAGHDVAVVHYDRCADQRWARTSRGAAILGAGLRVVQ